MDADDEDDIAWCDRCQVQTRYWSTVHEDWHQRLRHALAAAGVPEELVVDL